MDQAFPSFLSIGGREFRWGERTYVMGIVNVTPDSFAGDGVGTDVDAAVRQAIRMREDGADLIDVGGESTRPGFQAVTEEQEIRRTAPVIGILNRELDIPISIDTSKRRVAEAALEAGAHLINDIHGFRGDSRIAGLATKYHVPAVIMHNQRGRKFGDVIDNIHTGLKASITIALEEGLPRQSLIADPGFNFGWEQDQALEMLRRLDEIKQLGLPILIGTSRKSTIGAVLNLPVEERLEGTAATVSIAIAHGADIVRVHDVKEMVRVSRMTDAIMRSH